MATGDKRLRLQHFHKWVSFYNHRCRLELWRESESNIIPIEILQSPANNVKIDFPANGNFDKHFPIWGGTLDFQFHEQVEDLAKGIKKVSLNTVVSDYEREVRCDFYVEGELVYRGWQAPDLCEDYPHRNTRVIALTFIDGIGSLDTFPILTTEEENVAISQVSDYGYYGANLIDATDTVQEYGNSKETVFNIIKLCLDKAQMNFGFKVINDIYEIGLQTTDVRVFEKVWVDFLTYSKDKSSLNCLEVLTSIFRTFGLVVYQKRGFWHIVRTSYLESKNVWVEVYDKNGVYVTKVKNKTVNTLKYSEAEANTPKKWHILEEGFVRKSNPPCQYQNIIYEYGEDLIVNNYDNTPWSVRNVDAIGVTLGPDNYLKILDSKYEQSKFFLAVFNAGVGSEDKRRRLLNAQMIAHIKDGVISQEIDIYPENEITFSLSGLFRRMIFFVTVTDEDGVIYHFIPSLNRWINQELFINPSNGFTLTSPDLIASQMKFSRDNNTRSDQEGFYEAKFTFNRENSAKAIRDSGKKKKLGWIDVPVIEYVKSQMKVGKLTITLRGGSDQTSDDATEIYLRNIKVRIDQIKETHTFTNAGKVSYKPEDISVLNGDGSGTGYTKSSYFIQKEITTFPYISKPFPTKLWKDSSHQEANNLLSFASEMVVNAYAKRNDIVEATFRTRQKLWVGDVLRLPSFSKLGYKKYLIIPPFNYDVCEDMYRVTLFEITCNLAKGNTLEYYLDSNGSSIFRSQTFNDGYVCPQTFEAEGVCIQKGFTAVGICI